MALLCETQWHGNPRPRRSYKWFDTDGTQGVSLVPYAEKDDAATGTTDVAGPAATVSVSLAGPFPLGTVVAWTFTGDSTTETNQYTVAKVNGMSPEEVIADIAPIVDGNFGADGVASIDEADPRQMNVTAAGSNTTLTVTEWAVT